MQARAIEPPHDGPRPAHVERFTTAAIVPALRLQYWNDLASATFTGLSIDGANDAPFGATLDRLNLADVAIGVASAQASTIVHDDRHVAAQGSALHYLMHLQLTGNSVNMQAGREAHLAPGDFTICDTSRPYRVQFGSAATILVLRFDAARLRVRLPGINDAVSVRMPAAAGRSGLLQSLVKTLMSNIGDLDDKGACRDAADAIVDLAVLCLRHACSDVRPVRPTTIAERAFAIANEHFATPDFGVQQIAGEIGVSSRCIQKVFAAHGTTPTAHVLRQRLQAAARVLEATNSPVTEVALGQGFNDLSYFTRSFRRQFGCAPRDFRRIRRAAAA